jgi:uncharacterized protein (DUF1015 family)
VAEVRPFRAVRYDVERAGPLEELVAPPYDVIAPEERERYLARSPYNVVHLTLPDSEEAAGRAWREWLAAGVLAREPEPSFWAVRQDYVGPDGVERTRTGLFCSLRVEPYERRVVLPHERTHRGPKEGRLRLLRAVGAQLEPIFLLYDGEPPFAVPARSADLETEGTRLWRLGPEPAIADALADRRLLIADGHHRYETALAFHEEAGTEESAFMPVVLVSTADPGLTIFPTHRLFRTRPPGAVGTPEQAPDPETALRRLDELPRDAPAFVRYEPGSTEVVVGSNGKLDTELVDELGQEGLGYTASWRDAVRAVDSGEAAVAVLLRPTLIEQVFAVAERGGVLPQKSTYFFPKLLSGLLFQPV